MTIVLELSEELETELTAQAASVGLPLEEYALRKLAESPFAPEQPRNGHDLIAYWQNEGVVGSKPDILDSQAHARLLRDSVEKRSRE